MKKELFEELLASVKQAKAIEKGELKPARKFRVDSKKDIIQVRSKLGFPFWFHGHFDAAPP